jgi:hypothetical protein
MKSSVQPTIEYRNEKKSKKMSYETGSGHLFVCILCLNRFFEMQWQLQFLYLNGINFLFVVQLMAVGAEFIEFSSDGRDLDFG